MNSKTKKGFTLLEAVVTIGVLGVITAMTTAVIANMVNIQKASGDQYEYSEEMKDAFDLVDEYMSYVSIPRFSYRTSNTTSISFTYTFSDESTLNYGLSYSNNVLSYGPETEYSGSDEYFKKTNRVSLKNITSGEDSFRFTYDQGLSMLMVYLHVNGKSAHKNFYWRVG